MLIEQVLNKNKDFYNNIDNQNKYDKFKTKILNNFNRTFSIKKLFNKNLFFYIDEQIFNNVDILSDYYNKCKTDDVFKFKKIKINQNKKSLNYILNKLLLDNLTSDELIINIDSFDIFVENIEQIENELINKIKDNIKNIHFEISYDIFNNINIDSKEMEIFKSLFFNSSKITINYEININNYETHSEDIINIYENNMNIFRFFNLYFDYYSLSELNLNKMNDFKYYNSFLQRWIKENFQNSNEIEITNIKNNKVKSSLFVDNNGDVFINKDFQINNQEKLFNINDKIKTGEDIDFYELSLLYQQLIINEKSFIRNVGQETQPLIYDQLNYYYNFTENNAIQNLSQEIEILNFIVLRNFNPVSWKWRNF